MSQFEISTLDSPNEAVIRKLIADLRADADWLDGGAETATVELERAAANQLEQMLLIVGSLKALLIRTSPQPRE